MGPASLQKDSEPPPQQSEGEMENYRCLLQAGSQLESTLQREYTTRDAAQAAFNLWPPRHPPVCTQWRSLERDMFDLQFLSCPPRHQSGCRFRFKSRLMCHFLQICFTSGSCSGDYVSCFKPSQMNIRVLYL